MCIGMVINLLSSMGMDREQLLMEIMLDGRFKRLIGIMMKGCTRRDLGKNINPREVSFQRERLESTIPVQQLDYMFILIMMVLLDTLVKVIYQIDIRLILKKMILRIYSI